jgi:hypothetical protein
VVVRQQLLKGGREPTFTAPEGKTARTIEIAPETVELLKIHRAHQATLKMRNRQAYHDNGLVFAKEWRERRRGGADARCPPADQQSRSAGVREADRHRKSEADYVARSAAHLRDAPTFRQSAAKRRAATPRPQEGRDHARHLRARITGATTRGGSDTQRIATHLINPCPFAKRRFTRLVWR